MSHTQGTLVLDQFGNIKTKDGEKLLVDGVAVPCGHVPTDHIGNRNAIRLAACWNASIGIPTAELEAAADGRLLNIFEGLISERDELLEALKDVLSWLDDGNRDLSYACRIDVKNARTAIARAEKGGA